MSIFDYGINFDPGWGGGESYVFSAKLSQVQHNSILHTKSYCLLIQPSSRNPLLPYEFCSIETRLVSLPKPSWMDTILILPEQRLITTYSSGVL